MNIHLSRLLLLGLAVLSHGLAAEPIRIDGSSTVYPLTESVAEEFGREMHGNPRVLLGISGSKGGFNMLCRGLIDIANASRPINATEMAACRAAGIRYLELPVAFDAITVVVNPRNSWARSLTTSELRRIWEPVSEGVIMHWSDVRAGWPDERINLFMPGLNSATSEYFMNVVVGSSLGARRDLTCSENDNVLLQGVERDPNAIGFFGHSYYLNNKDKLTAVAIDCGCGETVRPSRETVLSGRYFPLSRPLFIYVRDTYLKRPELRRFVSYYLAHVERHANEMAFFPLPTDLYRMNQRRLNEPAFGTLFDGKKWSGLNIEEALSRVPSE